MKWEVIVSLALMAALAAACGGDVPPPPSAPGQSTGEMEEPALPAPEAVPSNPESGLLPESGELPAHPRAVTLPKLYSTHVSIRQAPAEGERFEAIQSLAMGDRRATRLLQRAKQSSNPVSRRIYLRAYYETVASRMRKLDPKLKSSINTYEEGKLHELSRGRTSTARVSFHHSKMRRSARLAGRHHWHKFSEEHRYRRIILIDGPYGPEFPPYGPPMVFEPR